MTEQKQELQQPTQYPPQQLKQELQQQLQQEMDDDPALVNIVYLDTISRKLTKLLEVSNNILQMNNQIFQTNNRILITTTQLLQTDSQILSASNNILSTSNNILQKNDNLLEKAEEGLTKSDELLNVNNSILQKSNDILLTSSNILSTNNDILNEQKAEADEAGRLISSGTVTTTTFTIIDTQIDPGHPVKGFYVKNTGNNTIYVGHNVAISSVGPDIIDIINTTSGFETLLKNEETIVSGNRNKIRNIYILATGGNSSYKAKLSW